MWAAQRGHRAVVELLLNAGAYPSAVDSDGLTAADYARAAGHTALASRLTLPMPRPDDGALR